MALLLLFNLFSVI